ncbi:MAG: ribosome recycling factor [Desulfobulbaceae bacterium]|nr:ribosome recycling factor [Desulfobulbaceae bacterium]
MNNELIAAMTEKMGKSMEAYKSELSRIRTGRASLSLLDGIKVEAYGAPMPLNQVASLTIPESRAIVLQPWDIQLLGTIEKAILKSDLGITPLNDGKIIRINIPQLTEERRKELVKQVKKIGEDYKVAIRNSRREAIDKLKKQKKDKEVSEDEMFKLQDDAQKETDRFVKDIDDIIVKKDKEVMEV